MIATIAKFMPEEKALEMVEKSLKAYKEDKTDKNRNALSFAMEMFNLKLNSHDMPLDQFIKKVTTVSRVIDRMESQDQ